LTAGEEPGPPAELKARLLRIALLPLVAAAVLGAGLVLLLTQTQPADRPSWMVPIALGSAAVLVALVAYLAASAASKTDADLGRQILAVRRSTVETHYKVWQVLDDLQRDLPADQRWSCGTGPLRPGTCGRRPRPSRRAACARPRRRRSSSARRPR
jgi:hypothetical protein